MATTTMSRGDQTRASIIKFIKAYWKKNETAPSLIEIADGVGLRTHNSVRTHLLVLRNQGQVTWREGQMRTVRVLEPKKVAKAR